MEEGAAELAVGDALEPDVLLPADRLSDAFVLDRAQLVRAALAASVARARREQPLGPQQAADLIGAERRLSCHLLRLHQRIVAALSGAIACCSARECGRPLIR